MHTKTMLAAGLAALLGTTAAFAEPTTIGMITTLSGGGAGLVVLLAILYSVFLM